GAKKVASPARSVSRSFSGKATLILLQTRKTRDEPCGCWRACKKRPTCSTAHSGQFSGLTKMRKAGATAIAGNSIHANDQSTRAEGPYAPRVEKQGSCAPAEPAETRRVHARVHDDPQEGQFRASENREGAAHQRLRGHQLHRRRRP